MDNKKKLSLTFAQKSDTGKQRDENQDSLGKFPADTLDIAHPKGQLFVVADGMGGHERGGEASETAVRVIGEQYFTYPSDDVAERLHNAFLAANEVIYNLYRSMEDSNRMGTTCSALVIANGKAYIGHVGDSKIFHINKSGVTQLTTDHTQVSEMHRRGILTEKEAAKHPRKSVLHRAVGIKKEITVDILRNIPVRAGDTYVLCTDGLANVSHEEMKDIVLANTPEDACKIMVDYAIQRGGEDNVTVQIVRFEEEKGPNKNITLSRAPTKKRTGILAGLIVVLVMLIILLIVFINQDTESPVFGERGAGVETLVSPEERIPELYKKADTFYKEGKLDSALTVYQSILLINPLHIGSVEGIERIAGEYETTAEEYLIQERYEQALRYFTKASELQRVDAELGNRIEEIKREIEETATDDDRMDEVEDTPDETPEPGIDEKPEEKVAEVDPEPHRGLQTDKWTFPGLSVDEYAVNRSGITFFESITEKKAIYQNTVIDKEFEVQIEAEQLDIGASVGLIIGYNSENGALPVYYLVSLVKNEGILLVKNSSDSEKILLEIPYSEDNDREDRLYNLKVRTLGPWVMIYENDRLLDSWLGESIIKGEFGLYADPEVNVTFSNFVMKPALNSMTR